MSTDFNVKFFWDFQINEKGDENRIEKGYIKKC